MRPPTAARLAHMACQVMLDFAKLFYAYLVNNDLDMYDEDTDTRANANSTALGEELGQVQYVLTDKTGTLTQNIMVFKAAWVADPGQPDTGPYGQVLWESDESHQVHGTHLPGLL